VPPVVLASREGTIVVVPPVACPPEPPVPFFPPVPPALLMLSPSVLVEQATTHMETHSAVRKPRVAFDHLADLFVFMYFLHEMDGGCALRAWGTISERLQSV
jgi:hypothetical protein